MCVCVNTCTADDLRILYTAATKYTISRIMHPMSQKWSNDDTRCPMTWKVRLGGLAGQQPVRYSYTQHRSHPRRVGRFIIMSKIAAASSAKKAGPGKQPKNASPRREGGGAARSNPALKWQLGGLIAGVVVALLSTTAPGQQVRDKEGDRERSGLIIQFSVLFCFSYCRTLIALPTCEVHHRVDSTRHICATTLETTLHTAAAAAATTIAECAWVRVVLLFC